MGKEMTPHMPTLEGEVIPPNEWSRIQGRAAKLEAILNRVRSPRVAAKCPLCSSTILVRGPFPAKGRCIVTGGGITAIKQADGRIVVVTE